MSANQSGNYSQPMPPQLIISPALIYASSSLNVLICLLTLIGNTLVVVSFLRTPKLRHCQTNYLIASLAVSDLISGFVAVPLWTAALIDRWSSMGATPKYFAFQAFDIFSSVASIIHLMCISLERYFAIVRPVTHHVASSLTYFIVMGVIWAISITAAFVSIVASRYPQKYVIFNSVTFFGIPLAVIIFSYLSIVRTTRQRRAYVKPSRNLEREVKVARTVFILVALFVITWAPFFTLALISTRCLGCATMDVVVFLKCLHYSNAFCNPIVYAARIPDFRIAFRKLLPKKLFLLLSCQLEESRDSSTTSRARSSSGFSVPESSPKATDEHQKQQQCTVISSERPKVSNMQDAPYASPSFSSDHCFVNGSSNMQLTNRLSTTQV